VVKEFCFAMKVGSPQIKQEGSDAKVIFQVGGGVGIAHDLYRTMGNIDVCTESELLEFKVLTSIPAWQDNRRAGTNHWYVDFATRLLRFCPSILRFYPPLRFCPPLSQFRNSTGLHQIRFCDISHHGLLN